MIEEQLCFPFFPDHPPTEPEIDETLFRLFVIRRMKVAVLLSVALLLSAKVAYSGSTAKRSSSPTPSELAIIAVTVELTMSVRVIDAETGAPISGATVTLVRASDGKNLAPPGIAGSDETQITNHRGTTRLKAGWW